MTSQSLDTCPILKNFTLAVSPVPPPTPTNLLAGGGEANDILTRYKLGFFVFVFDLLCPLEYTGYTDNTLFVGCRAGMCGGRTHWQLC